MQDTEYSYDRAYKKHREDGIPMLVLCGAEWCGPCKKMKETLFEMKKNGELDGIAIAYVDIDKEPDVFDKIKSGTTVPQIHMFSSDNKRVFLRGLQTRLKLREVLKRLRR